MLDIAVRFYRVCLFERRVVLALIGSDKKFESEEIERRSDRVVDCDGLESHCDYKVTVGSNPTFSANQSPNMVRVNLFAFKQN